VVSACARAEPPLPDGVTYPRVVPRSKPVRTEVVGPLGIETIASGFSDVRWGDRSASYTAAARFAVRHRGEPGTIGRKGVAKDAETIQDVNASYDRADVVAVVGSPKAARDLRAPAGRVDRTLYASPGLYRVDGAVLDTRSLAVHRYAAHRAPAKLDAVPPLALSPDERSFAQLDFAPGSCDQHVLKVTDLEGERMPAAPDAFARAVRIDGDVVHVYYSADYRNVGVFMDRGGD
jgi:hypothetical protein